MVQIENKCIECDRQMSCLSNMCDYGNVKKYYCDRCNSYAIYRIGDEDMCKDCAEQYCNDLWCGLSIEDKCELLEVYFERIVNDCEQSNFI